MRRRARTAMASIAAVAMSAAVPTASAGEPTPVEEPRGEILVARGSAPPCGTVLLGASGWLGGRGVEVHSNGATQGGRSCGGFSVANPSVQSGGAWQCVELAARLYNVKGWGIVYAGRNGGARYIPEGSPNLEFHANGSGYTPVPGDLVIEAFGTYGHVAVVDGVRAGAIDAIEQNANLAARKSYPWSSGVAAGAYNGGVVRGFMHSPLNAAPQLKPGEGHPASRRPQLSSVRGKAAGSTIVLRWRADSDPSITGFKIQLRRDGLWGGGWSPGVVLAPTARRFRIGITPGMVYRFRVAALGAAGRGAWRKTPMLHP